jgi:hypothetical protein
MDILIATRTYPLHCLKSGREYLARDCMYRKPCGSFVLKETSDMPGELDGERAFDLESVFAWLRELPWQIEREVLTAKAA